MVLARKSNRKNEQNPKAVSERPSETNVRTDTPFVGPAGRRFLGKNSRKQAAQGPTKGTQTRQLIVDRALNIAAQEGLGVLSIGRLAKDLNMSKSGLVLHFGSKANLELAVVERADLYFFDYIMVPIDEKGLQGIERVWALCDSWLEFVEQRRLPGGYFFSGAYFQCAGQS